MKPGLAAAGPSLRKGARDEKQEERKNEKEEAEYQKAYRGEHIPVNVTQKGHYACRVVTGREKHGFVIRTYKWHVRWVRTIGTTPVRIMGTHNRYG